MLIDLVENATLLISLCWLHGMITRYLDENTLPGKLAAGSLFGIVCVAGMLMPLTLAEGLIFDGRTVVLSMASSSAGRWWAFWQAALPGFFVGRSAASGFCRAC